MSSDYNFQKELKGSIFNADPNLDRKELLIDIFKSYVAKMFEFTMTRKENAANRIEFKAMVEIKRNLISEFRKTSLSEFQLSVKQYEDLFDATMQEITNFAGINHGGIDNTTVEKTLNINKDAYNLAH